MLMTGNPDVTERQTGRKSASVRLGARYALASSQIDGLPDPILLTAGSSSTEYAFKDRPPRIIVANGRGHYPTQCVVQIPLIGYNQAPPRTPLELPCMARTMGVPGSAKKM